jgi:hypothetical protein
MLLLLDDVDTSSEKVVEVASGAISMLVSTKPTVTVLTSSEKMITGWWIPVQEEGWHVLGVHSTSARLAEAGAASTVGTYCTRLPHPLWWNGTQHWAG